MGNRFRRRIGSIQSGNWCSLPLPQSLPNQSHLKQFVDNILFEQPVYSTSNTVIPNIKGSRMRFYGWPRIFCLFLGVIAFFSDLRFPDETAEFFGIDVLQSYEDYFADVKDAPNIRVKPNHTKDKDLIEQNVSRVYAGLRKRNLSNRFSRLQKSWNILEIVVNVLSGVREMS
ncbi:unnamed protein product [Oppiella nova]|uniref:Uncharacterized protein n=1 Tax=Oppiella nova TaxID=334625 RepID=A0A7R9LF24_9ACAR|nr:unnamed protein product [Oppiella nova]CAG2163018.1 unnamed protein product [Oppiella nova]